MKFVVPITVDDTNLTSNLTNEAADWTAGTYNTGTKKVEGELVYEVVADPSTTDQPSVGAAKDTPTWIVLGYANIWRMWREGSDSVSTNEGDIEVSVEPINTVITTVGVLNVDAFSVTVELIDDVEGVIYSQTKSVADIGVIDWWEYFFTDYDRTKVLIFEGIPAYFGVGVSCAVTVNAASPSDTVAVGRVVIGRALDAGRTLQGVQSRNMTFSKKERDEFGNLTLVNRRTIRVIDYPVMLQSNQADSVQRKAEDLAATPTLFIGDSTKPETIVFGVFESFDIIVKGLSVVECSISVEEF